MTWIKNNLITIVEIIGFIYDGIEIIVNGFARLFPGNKVVKTVHDLLAKVDAPLKSLKSFLLGKVGS